LVTHATAHLPELIRVHVRDAESCQTSPSLLDALFIDDADQPDA